MVSIALFVLLLATYAYSIPLGLDDTMSKQNNVSQPIVMHLVDDGESTPFPTTGQVPLTTQRSPLNNGRALREMLEPLEPSFAARGIEESSTLFLTTVESSTSFPTTVESSTQAVVRPLREMLDSFGPPLTEQKVKEPLTSLPLKTETKLEFNEHKIRGQNVQSGKDLQTTEEPTSSVSSFATTTGLLRTQRGEQTEEEGSTPVAMNETTTEFSSTGRSKTVIELISGPNTKTEIISGPNTKTEIISGPNTITEISSQSSKQEFITNVPGRLIGGGRELSQGKN